MTNETERPEQVIANLKTRLRDAELMLEAKDREMSQTANRVAGLEALAGECRHALVMCQASSKQGSALRNLALTHIDISIKKEP